LSSVARSHEGDTVPPPVSTEAALTILREAISELSLADSSEDIHSICRTTALRLIDAGCEPEAENGGEERLNLFALVGPETDALTELANGHAWQAALSEAVGKRTLPLTIAVLDLDHLQTVIGVWGDAAGDQLLVDTAAAWRGVLRDGDLLARLDGSRFAVMFGGCDLSDARFVAERLRKAVPYRQSASVGIASWDGDEDAGALVARAEVALRNAKAARKGRLTLAA
jgi:diguanylate cyclase (GGDEF)-like protein